MNEIQHKLFELLNRLDEIISQEEFPRYRANLSRGK